MLVAIKREIVEDQLEISEFACAEPLKKKVKTARKCTGVGGKLPRQSFLTKTPSTIFDGEITNTSMDSSFSSQNNPKLEGENIDDSLEEGEIIDEEGDIIEEGEIIDDNGMANLDKCDIIDDNLEEGKIIDNMDSSEKVLTEMENVEVKVTDSEEMINDLTDDKNINSACFTPMMNKIGTQKTLKVVDYSFTDTIESMEGFNSSSSSEEYFINTTAAPAKTNTLLLNKVVKMTTSVTDTPQKINDVKSLANPSRLNHATSKRRNLLRSLVKIEIVILQKMLKKEKAKTISRKEFECFFGTGVQKISIAIPKIGKLIKEKYGEILVKISLIKNKGIKEDLEEVDLEELLRMNKEVLYCLDTIGKEED